MQQIGMNSVRLSSAFVLWALITILRLLGVVQVYGWDPSKFSPGPEGLLVIHRHPSYFMEVWYLPALLFPQYLFCPSKMPLVVADRKNFGKLRYLPFRSMMILVDRKDTASRLSTVRKIRKHLKRGRVVFMAPGGGRERTGEKYKILRGGVVEKIDRPEGKFDLREPILRRFESGVGLLVTNGVTVVIIWVEPRGFLGSARVVMGEPRKPGLSLLRQDLVDRLEDDMLNLAVR